MSRNVAVTDSTCNLMNCGNVTNAGGLGSGLSFRPRGSLARALYQRQIHDEYLNSLDKNEVSK